MHSEDMDNEITVFLDEDRRRLNFTQRIREELANEILNDEEKPWKKNRTMAEMLVSLLKDMDNTTLSVAKLRMNQKENDNNSAMIDMVNKVLDMANDNNVIETRSRDLKLDHKPDVVPGEIDIGVVTLDYKDFTDEE